MTIQSEQELRLHERRTEIVRRGWQPYAGSPGVWEGWAVKLVHRLHTPAGTRTCCVAFRNATSVCTRSVKTLRPYTTSTFSVISLRVRSEGAQRRSELETARPKTTHSTPVTAACRYSRPHIRHSTMSEKLNAAKQPRSQQTCHAKVRSAVCEARRT